MNIRQAAWQKRFPEENEPYIHANILGPSRTILHFRRRLNYTVIFCVVAAIWTILALIFKA